MVENDSYNDQSIFKGSKLQEAICETPQELADRMEVLIRIANRLHGTLPNIDDPKTKKIILRVFATIGKQTT